ncbi:MAG: FtsW/RodA/SpoVE family cell cycle protein [Oscillospiraceae bacterium]|jgi:cell division protein FtsW|nr:FtsW/RodA/SpoVE family cell cycle protein [Oscillospiraceae bacterium]
MDRRDNIYDFEKHNEPSVGLDPGILLDWGERGLSDELIDTGKRSPGIDKPFLVITLVILLIGVIMVLSASFARGVYMQSDPLRLFVRQLAFAATGIVLMWITSRIKIRVISQWSMQLLLISVVLLVLVLIIGIRVNGARRWIGIGGENSSLTFQPSEIAKLALILSFAQMMCKLGKEKMKTFKFGVIPFAIVTLIMIILLRMEPHLSAIIIITTLAAIMMFAGGTRLRWFLIAVAIIIAMVSGFIYFQLRSTAPEVGIRDVSVTTVRENLDLSGLGYEGRRIGAWLNPDADPLRDGFQIRQSLNAVGSGGLLGLGLGQSRQKHLYLPEEHNDYIFFFFCEELGFIGAMLILLLFVLLIVRGYWLAMHANDKYSSLITIGITSLLALQVFLNVAVVTNLLPATGISLPFFSYGGTALWIQLVQIGIILAVSREIPLQEKRK